MPQWAAVVSSSACIPYNIPTPLLLRGRLGGASASEQTSLVTRILAARICGRELWEAGNRSTIASRRERRLERTFPSRRCQQARSLQPSLRQGHPEASDGCLDWKRNEYQRVRIICVQNDRGRLLHSEQRISIDYRSRSVSASQ